MIPDYLKPYASWTGKMFYKDTLRRGHTKAEAKRFALMYPHLLGTKVLEPKEISCWIAYPGPIFADGGKVAFLYRRGRKHQYFSASGKKVGPEQAHLVGAVSWAEANEWYYP